MATRRKPGAKGPSGPDRPMPALNDGTIPQPEQPVLHYELGWQGTILYTVELYDRPATSPWLTYVRCEDGVRVAPPGTLTPL